MIRTTCLLFLLVIVVSLISCKEKYRSINPLNFNQKIAVNPNIKTTQQLIEAYDTAVVTCAKHPGGLLIDSSITDGKMKITATLKIYDDDELAAEKYVMIAKHNGLFWEVFEIRYNWKYRDSYGHTDWGI